VTEQLVNSLLSRTATVPKVDSSPLFLNFAAEACNVAGAPLLIFDEERVRTANYTGDYEFGGKLFSKNLSRWSPEEMA
jgi:hypothetical protein